MTKQYYLAKNRKQHSPEFYSEDLNRPGNPGD